MSRNINPGMAIPLRGNQQERQGPQPLPDTKCYKIMVALANLEYHADQFDDGKPNMGAQGNIVMINRAYTHADGIVAEHEALTITAGVIIEVVNKPAWWPNKNEAD